MSASPLPANARKGKPSQVSVSESAQDRASRNNLVATTVASLQPPVKQLPARSAPVAAPTYANEPQSINYYESYFDDSYIGDFAGEEAEIDEDSPQEQDIQTWSGDTNIDNSLLEFGFDSFGPESLLFPGSQDAHYPQPTALEQEAELMSLSVAEPQLREKVEACFDMSRIKNSYDLSAEQNINGASIAKDDSTISSTQSTNEKHKTELNPQIEEQVAPQIEIESPPMSPEGTSEKDESTSASEKSDSLGQAFSRDSTLTRSQRRKISPRINFEQILNGPDELSSPKVAEAYAPSLLHAVGDGEPDHDKESVTENGTNIEEKKVTPVGRSLAEG